MAIIIKVARRLRVMLLILDHFQTLFLGSTDRNLVEVLRTAVDAGELDARIESISGLVKAGFEKEGASSKRNTLMLPTKNT